jgi:hypothetical protein
MIKYPLTKQQLSLILLGKEQRKSLENAVLTAIKSARVNKRKHTLVYSPTGLGKTYVFKKVLDNNKIKYSVISGKNSLFQIALNLMVLYYLKPKGEQLIILFDDCDMFFTKQDLMNVLKNMTEGEHSLVYNVLINESQLTKIQLEAYKKCKSPYGKGIIVPCNEFTFLFTTNFMLPFDKQADLIRKKDGSSAKAEKIESLAAFRSRFRTKDYPMDKNTKWGYLAYVLLELDLFPELDNYQKSILIDWVWNNWDKMKETNLRTLEKMSEDMINNEDDFKDIWEQDYLMFDFNF